MYGVHVCVYGSLYSKYVATSYIYILTPGPCLICSEIKTSMRTNTAYISHPKTAYSCKKSVRPNKAELTATKSNDIIMRPCTRCASCKINIS